MRLVLDGRMILPAMTGVGRYLLDLVPALLEESPDLQLDLWLQAGLPPDHPVWTLAQERLEIQVLPYRHMSLAGQWGIPLKLLRSKPDVFHCPHFDLPWGAPGKIVSTIHDLKYIVHPEYLHRIGLVKRLAMRVMMTYTCWRSRLVIVDSRRTAQDLSTILGVLRAKMRIVPLGVDDLFFQRCSDGQRGYVLDHYQLSTPFLLFVGERRPHKNLVGLIRSFEIFSRSVSTPYRLVIAGKRYADDQAPEETVQELGLEDRVSFLDDLPDPHLPALYQSADAFVLLSHYEGFGLPVLEAMASGTPVVAADSASLPEVVGEAGILVDPDQPDQAASALKSVITGGALRQEKIAAGLARARQFSWASCARKTLEIYQEAASL